MQKNIRKIDMASNRTAILATSVGSRIITHIYSLSFYILHDRIPECLIRYICNFLDLHDLFI